MEKEIEKENTYYSIPKDPLGKIPPLFPKDEQLQQEALEEQKKFNKKQINLKMYLIIVTAILAIAAILALIFK